jgi:replication-associated recombination protein RarA
VAGKVNLNELIRRLELDRRRCFVITGRPGEGKTRLAKQMAKRYHGQYLDLLTTFAQNADLAVHIDTFTPRRCKDFLQSQAQGELVLIDEFEFLWHRWNDSEKREFLNIIKVWSKPAFFGFFLSADLLVDQFDMPDQDGHTRIFSLHDLQLS